MAKVTLMSGGIKIAKAAGCNKMPDKRGDAKGWTVGSARRNTSFLMSIDERALSHNRGKELPFALSLTFGREAIISPDDLRAIRKKFLDRLRLAGVIRLHWLVEFQRDGTPHLHMLVYMPFGPDPDRIASLIRGHWLDVAAGSGARASAQHVVPVGHLNGWQQYLAKHGARGVRHYQRTMPEGWEKPGRMWGKVGEWPVLEWPFETDETTFFRFRRINRSYEIARKRKELRAARPEDRARLVKVLSHARKCLADPREDGSRKSALRGMALWMPLEVSQAVLEHLANFDGAMVRDWADKDQAPGV